MAGIDLGAGLREIVAESTRQGVDPYAAIAVAKREGLGGGIGDGGTSFGPFQIHYGGAYPASAPHGSPQASQEWAWSKEGIDYAVRQIGTVAGGKRGPSAVDSIVRYFERPQGTDSHGNIAPGSVAAQELVDATRNYAQLSAIRPALVTSSGTLAPGAVGAIASGGSAGAGILGTGLYPPSGSTVNDAAKHIPGVAQVESAGAAISSVGDALSFVFSVRFLEILGGLGLIGLGIAGLTRSQPVTKVVANIVDTNDRRRGGPRTSTEGTGRGRTTTVTLDADRPAPRRGEPGSAQLGPGDALPF